MVFQQGETVVVLTYLYLYNTEVLTDATTVVIEIDKPDGTEELAEIAMTHVSTGIYTYNHNTSATGDLGIYSVKITATSGTVVTIMNDNYKLVEAI